MKAVECICQAIIIGTVNNVLIADSFSLSAAANQGAIGTLCIQEISCGCVNVLAVENPAAFVSPAPSLPSGNECPGPAGLQKASSQPVVEEERERERARGRAPLSRSYNKLQRRSSISFRLTAASRRAHE